MNEKTVGPKTTRQEFFGRHIDLSRPEFAGLKEALEGGDIPLCEKIFADAVRKSPSVEYCMKLRKEKLSGISEQWRDTIYQRARDAMNYTVNCLGVKHTFADKKIDWTVNPTYNNYAEWPWVLSRHTELGNLAQYYYVSGDENAAIVFADYLDSWIKQAIVPEYGTSGGWPEGVGRFTWRSIEAGLRMHVWFEYFNTVINSPNISDSLICDFYTSVYEHGMWLRYSYTTFNWLIMEMHGLVSICLNAPFISYVDEWFDFAIERLVEQLDVQLYPDGFQCELTTNYHPVVDLNYEHVIELLQSFGKEIPDTLLKALEKAFDFYYKMMRPDGRLPDINDGNEYDAVMRLGKIAKYYPDNETYRYFYTHGKEGKAPEQLSYPFEYSGAMVMRTGWEKDAVWSYMDCSPFGIGHQHEDKLNVLLYAYGKNLLIEGGNYDYDTSDMRRYVVSTRAHNTVMLGGKEQKRGKTYRREDMDINAKADLKYTAGQGYETAVSHYNEGYGDDLENMVHTRRLIFVKDAAKFGLKPFFIVVDRFTAEDNGARKYEQMWHFEECEYTQDKDFAIGDYGDGVGIMLASSDKDASFVNMRGQYEPYYQGWYKIQPCGPHEHRPIHTPVLVGQFEGKRRVVTVLYPYNEGENNFVSVEGSCDFDALDITLNTKNGSFELSESDFE